MNLVAPEPFPDHKIHVEYIEKHTFSATWDMFKFNCTCGHFSTWYHGIQAVGDAIIQHLGSSHVKPHMALAKNLLSHNAAIYLSTMLGA